MEVDQLRRDNATLLATLKTFRDADKITHFIDDSGGQVSKLPSRKQSKVNEDAEEENQDMIPGQAFQVANKFRTQHGNDLTPELINELLRKLNQIWQKREKKQIARIK